MRLDPKAVPSPISILVFSLLVITASLNLTGCGTVNAAGNGSSAPNKQSISVTTAPPNVDLVAGEAQQFTANVTGTTNTAVEWAVDGVVGGNATVGTVTDSGLYTAPSDMTSDSSVTLAAMSAADLSQTATAMVRIWRRVNISISPTAASVQTGGSQQFTATVSRTWNTRVTWSVNGVPGGNAVVGTISSDGLYTAPSSVPAGSSVTVTATSVAQSYRSASATITITGQPVIAVSVSPANASLQQGGTQQFGATVTGTTNTAVTWLVNGTPGGNSTVGTITSSGLYTAPASVASSTTYTVSARSVADTTKTANAIVTVNPPTPSVAVSVSPASANLQAGGTQQFSASISGTSNTAVMWLVNGTTGGNSAVGTITSGGLYTAPASVASTTNVTVTARSAADTTKSATATITLNPPTPSVAVSVSPANANLQAGGTQQFSASVSGTSNTAVTWLVNGTAGGNGTIGTITTSGLYTAPASVASSTTYTVTARSVADSTKSGNAAVTVNPTTPIVAVSVTPSNATLQSGLTQQFTASVTGSTNTAVTWSVNGVAGGNSSVGTISTSGLFTAPTVSSTTSETITVKSVADATKSASAAVSIAPKSSGNVTVSVSPTSISLGGSATQQFSATVSGTTNTAVNWSVNGVAGGNSTYGSISSTGLYTAPPCSSSSTVTVTATSVYDGTAKANSAVALTGGTGSSTTHFVAVSGNDSNDGSACHPWATIGKAARSVKSGDTVIVEDGEYPENISINVGGSSESNRVTFRSQNKWGAHISGVNNGTSSTATNTITVSASYVTIQDFEITGWDYTGYGIKEQNPAHHINVIGNNIHSMGKGATACVRGGGIGAVNYTLIEDNHIWDISIYPRGRVRCNYQHGIYVLGGDGGSIINNSIYEIWEGIGIQFDGARYNNWTVANNTIFNVAYNSGGDGGAMYFNCDGSSSLGAGTCDNNVWRNNIFDNSSRYCWFVTSTSGGTLGANNVYDHNLTYNCGGSSFQKGSATNQLTSDPQFVNYQDDGSGDYHLQSTSPARNGGTNNSCPATDQDGVSRPQEGVCDIGAFEYH